MATQSAPTTTTRVDLSTLRVVRRLAELHNRTPPAELRQIVDEYVARLESTDPFIRHYLMGGFEDEHHKHYRHGT